MDRPSHTHSSPNFTYNNNHNPRPNNAYPSHHVNNNSTHPPRGAPLPVYFPPAINPQGSTSVAPAAARSHHNFMAPQRELAMQPTPSHLHAVLSRVVNEDDHHDGSARDHRALSFSAISLLLDCAVAANADHPEDAVAAFGGELNRTASYPPSYYQFGPQPQAHHRRGRHRQASHPHQHQHLQGLMQGPGAAAVRQLLNFHGLSPQQIQNCLRALSAAGGLHFSNNNSGSRTPPFSSPTPATATSGPPAPTSVVYSHPNNTPHRPRKTIHQNHASHSAVSQQHHQHQQRHQHQHQHQQHVSSSQQPSQALSASDPVTQLPPQDLESLLSSLSTLLAQVQTILAGQQTSANVHPPSDAIFYDHAITRHTPPYSDVNHRTQPQTPPSSTTGPPTPFSFPSSVATSSNYHGASAASSAQRESSSSEREADTPSTTVKRKPTRRGGRRRTHRKQRLAAERALAEVAAAAAAANAADLASRASEYAAEAAPLTHQPTLPPAHSTEALHELLASLQLLPRPAPSVNSSSSGTAATECVPSDLEEDCPVDYIPSGFPLVDSEEW